MPQLTNNDEIVARSTAFLRQNPKERGHHAQKARIFNYLRCIMKDKILRLISSINPSLILFVAYAIKMTMFSANYAEAMVLAILAGTYSYCRVIRLKEPLKRSDKLRDEVDKMSGELKEIKAVMSRVNISTVGQTKKRF